MSTVLAEHTTAWLLNQEDCDCDDQRFYCSYFISHSSLCLDEAVDDKSYFSNMEQSLLKGLATDQLTEQDRSGIQSLWTQAIKKFTTS
ncbi:hypothetical protein [Candidatus Halocynthiibacter alkanivorans]|uniref:hypothetical protein n=1 Tax=Candidatus Halocynthiibacter alkanivorans TaxID=2267619 RepID=UPI000DF3C642|nr:hypothetical protein [Candidatus Halocynthiibacter alkanivorans]